MLEEVGGEKAFMALLEVSLTRTDVTRTDFPQLIDFDLKHMVTGSALGAAEAPPPLTLEELETAKERGDELYWLLSSDGARAGYYWIEQRTDCLFLSAVVISSSHRNQGLGRQILKWVDEAARVKRISKCALAVAPENAPALHLYLSVGYRIVRTDTDYFGSICPNKVRLILEKNLQF